MNREQHTRLLNIIRQGRELLVAADRKRALHVGEKKRIGELERMERFCAGGAANVRFDNAAHGLGRVLQIFQRVQHNVGGGETQRLLKRWMENWSTLRREIEYGADEIDNEDFDDEDEQESYEPAYDSSGTTGACSPREADRTMATPSGVFAMKDLVSGPLVHGAKVAAADEAGKLVLSMAEKFLGDSYPAVMASEKGQNLAKVVMATLIKTLAHNGLIPNDTVNVCKACDLVLEAAGRDLVQPMIVELSPALKSLASLTATADAEE